MASEGDRFDELTAKFSKHIKRDSLGRMAMRARDKGLREEWAGIDERVRVGARLLALVRFTHELEAEAVMSQRVV